MLHDLNKYTVMILVENQMDICLAKHNSSHNSRKVSNYIEQCGLKLHDT